MATPGIRLIQEEFAPAARHNGPRRSAIAVMDGRRIQIGMNMSEHVDLKIDGMHCDGCVRRVTALLKRVEGLQVEHVEVGLARMILNEGAIRADAVRAVESGGFKVAD